jgi:hypothetical protein
MCSVNTRAILLAAVTVARGVAGGLGALAAAGGGCGALAAAERDRRQVDRLCVFLLRLLAALTAPLAVLNVFLQEWLDQSAEARGPPSTGGAEAAAALPVSLWQPAHISQAAAAEEGAFDPVVAMSSLGGTGGFGCAWDLSQLPWFGRDDFDWAAMLRMPAWEPPDVVQQVGVRPPPDGFGIDGFLALCNRCGRADPGRAERSLTPISVP